MTQDIQGAAPEVKELKSLEPQPVSEKKRLWRALGLFRPPGTTRAR